jgi:hypothetical protein
MLVEEYARCVVVIVAGRALLARAAGLCRQMSENNWRSGRRGEREEENERGNLEPLSYMKVQCRSSKRTPILYARVYIAER